MQLKFLIFLALSILLVAANAQQNVPVKNVEDLDELGTEMREKITKSSEKFEFAAQVDKMMKLIIHSLYKAKEIFLRELISNASDALDKVRFLSLTNPSILGKVNQLNITVKADPDRRTIVITDTGVGMTKEELIKNLGTIAKSGTSEFLQQLENKAADSTHLIGQFGVGFYSAFLVAERVTVISKSNSDEKQWIWQSAAENDFSVAEDPRGVTLGRGTQIVLHLKEEADKYLEEDRLEGIIRKYSEFINFPIYLQMNKTETVEVPLSQSELDKEAEKAKVRKELKKQKNRKSEEELEEEAKEADAKGEEAEVEDVEDDEEEEEEPKTTKEVERSYFEWVLMNPSKPIWTRDVKNVTETEYQEFYQSFTKDTEEPMSYSHFKAEGDADFKALLYIPSKAPASMLQSPDMHIHAVKLFVRRVFITDELLDFIPKYLGFLKGLVDSDDLPLNVSRETLQQHRLLKMIKKKVVQKALELIAKLSTDEDKYELFLKEYGTSLKLGVIEDTKNRKKLIRLLRFYSSGSEKRISLDSYFRRMKKGQDQIYFLTGTSLDEIKNSPFVEKVIARGYEVLYMDEPIDEYVVQNVGQYERKTFQNVAKEGLLFGDENEDDKEAENVIKEEYQPLTKYFSSVLGKLVDKVTVSTRLTKSPCAIVAGQYGMTGNAERLFRSQALASGNEAQIKQYEAMQKKTFEINPKHPVIKALLKQVNGEEIDESTDELVQVLYETTAIRSGYMLTDTTNFANRIERVLRSNLGVDLNEAVPDEKVKQAPEFETSRDSEQPAVEEEEEVTMEDFEHDEL